MGYTGTVKNRNPRQSEGASLETKARIAREDARLDRPGLACKERRPRTTLLYLSTLYKEYPSRNPDSIFGPLRRLQGLKALDRTRGVADNRVGVHGKYSELHYSSTRM